jgi:hypothetical protein
VAIDDSWPASFQFTLRADDGPVIAIVCPYLPAGE